MQVYRCVLDHALSLCQCKLGSGRFLEQFSVSESSLNPGHRQNRLGFKRLMGELVKSMELKRGLIPTDLSLAPLWLSAVISNAVTSFSVCVAGDYWRKTLSLHSHLQGEGGKGLGMGERKEKKARGRVERRLWGKPGRERRHLPEWAIVFSCVVA